MMTSLEWPCSLVARIYAVIKGSTVYIDYGRLTLTLIIMFPRKNCRKKKKIPYSLITVWNVGSATNVYTFGVLIMRNY